MSSNLGLVLGGETGKRPLTDPKWRLSRNLSRIYDLLTRVVKDNQAEIKQMARSATALNRRNDSRSIRQRLSATVTENKENITPILRAMSECKIGLARWGEILRECGSIIRHYFNNEEKLSEWFPQFDSMNITSTSCGAPTLRSFLLSERADVWSDVVWKEGCIGHAPATVSSNPQMLLDVDVPATLKKLKSELLTSRAFELSLRSGDLVLSDVEYFTSAVINRITDSRNGNLDGSSLSSIVKNSVWDFIHTIEWKDLVNTLPWKDSDLLLLLGGSESDINILLLNCTLSNEDSIFTLIQLVKSSSHWKSLLKLLEYHFSTKTVSYHDTYAVRKLIKDVSRDDPDRNNMTTKLMLRLIKFRTILIASIVSLKDMSSLLSKENIDHTILYDDNVTSQGCDHDDDEDPMASYILKERKSEKKRLKAKKEEKKKSKRESKRVRHNTGSSNDDKEKEKDDNNDELCVDVKRMKGNPISDPKQTEDVIDPTPADKEISAIQLHDGSKLTAFDFPRWAQSRFQK